MAFGGKSEGEAFNSFITKLRDDLQRQDIVSRLEFAGSRYKGTSVDESDYDVMFVKREPGLKAESSLEYPEFFRLTRGYSVLETENCRESFKEQLRASLKRIGAAQYTTIKRSYGPTNVVLCRLPGFRPFEVDMVYALEDGIGNQYVAKPPPNGDSALWYKTRVLSEKNHLRTIDKGNEAGRWAVRRLKQVVQLEPALRPVPSYCFEQVLMYLKEQRQDKQFWNENNMKEILAKFLDYMGSCLRRGELLAYHDRTNNTIQKLSQSQRNQIADRFAVLAKNPQYIIDRTN